MIWILNGDINVRWTDKKNKTVQSVIRKDLKTTNSNTETFEETSSKVSETVFTWNDSKQSFDWGNCDNAEHLYLDSTLSSYNSKNNNSSRSSVSDLKLHVREVKIDGIPSNTVSKDKASSREEKKLQYYEELFKRQEARNARKKLKNRTKKVQKPQETKVYRKRGRKPKNQKQTNKVFLKELSESNNSSECKIEIIQTTKYFDMNAFGKPKVNIRHQNFGSFEKQHYEIADNLEEKNSKVMNEDYHDHSTINDSMSNSTIYLANFDSSKLTLFDKIFKSSSTSSNIQNLNKYAIDFKSQLKLKDDYWSKLLEITKSVQSQKINSQKKDQLLSSSHISAPSINNCGINDINEHIVKNLLNLCIQKDSEIFKIPAHAQDESSNYQSLARSHEPQAHKLSTSDCSKLEARQVPESAVIT